MAAVSFRQIEKSFGNLPHVKVDYPGNLSTYDLLYADHVLFTSEALDILTGERGPVFEEPQTEPSDTEEEEPGGRRRGHSLRNSPVLPDTTAEAEPTTWAVRRSG